MANKRNFEWPQATIWDGFFTQDKSGGVTQRVDPATVFARLLTEGFLQIEDPDRDDYVLGSLVDGTRRWVPNGRSTGVVEALLPELIRTTSTVTVPACRVQLHDNPNFLGQPLRYSMPQATFTIPDDGLQYFVAVHLVTGSAVAYLETTVSALNMSNVVPLWTCTRIGSQIHALGFDTLGAGLPQKNEVALLRTSPYRLSMDGGLTPSEDGSRHILVAPGQVFAGTTPVDVLSYTSASHRLTECFHTAGVWTYTATESAGVYNNSHYDNGTNKVALGPQKYKNIWIFRSIGGDRETFYLHSRAEYSTPAAAREELRPAIPPVVSWHCFLVGRITVQNGASSGIVDDFTRSNMGAILSPSGEDKLVAVAADDLTPGYLLDKLGIASGSALTMTRVGNKLVLDVTQADNADPVLLTSSLLTENGTIAITGTCWAAADNEAGGAWGGTEQGSTDKYFKLLPLARGTISKAMVYVAFVNGADPFMGAGSYGAIRVGLFTAGGVLKGATTWFRGVNTVGPLSLTMLAEPGQDLTIERNTLYWVGVIGRGLDLVAYTKASTALNLTTLRHSVGIRNAAGGAAWSEMTNTSLGSVSNAVPILMLSAN